MIEYQVCCGARFNGGDVIKCRRMAWPSHAFYCPDCRENGASPSQIRGIAGRVRLASERCRLLRIAQMLEQSKAVIRQIRRGQ